MSLEQLKKLIASCCLLDARFYCQHSASGCGCATPLLELPQAWLDLLGRTPVAGMIWFKENLNTVEQIRHLNTQVYSLYSDTQQATPLLAIDQEGGRVFRTPLDQTTSFAGHMALGAADDATLTRAVSGQIAKELRSLGFNYNFTPCVDINNNPDNPVINVRAFGDQACLVSKHAQEVCRGMNDFEVLNAIKHFPGHGNTATDSHLGVPKITVSAELGQQVELAPFAALIERRVVDTVMTAHIQFPAFDDSYQELDSGERITPIATISKPILSGLLRDSLGFSGVIVTDAMDMGAVAELMSAEEAAFRALIAGADLLLMPKRMQCEKDLHAFDQFLQAVAERIQANPDHIATLTAAAARVDRLRAKAAIGATDFPLRSSEALTLERELIRKSLVSLDQFVPLSTGSHIDVVATDVAIAELMARALRNQGLVARVVDRLSDLGAAPLLVISQTPSENAIDSGRSELGCQEQHFSLAELRAYAATTDDSYWLSVRTPYDLRGLKVGARFACFNYKTALDEAGLPMSPLYDEFARLLLGEWQAEGQLPVAL